VAEYPELMIESGPSDLQTWEGVEVGYLAAKHTSRTRLCGEEKKRKGEVGPQKGMRDGETSLMLRTTDIGNLVKRCEYVMKLERSLNKLE
jgi:hypothetical protein